MDARGNRQYKDAVYVTGSTARNLSATPKRKEEEYRESVTRRQQRPEQNGQEQRKKQKKARRVPAVSRGIDFFSMAFLTIAMGVTLFTCLDYLKMQSQLLQLDKQNVTLSSQLSTLTDKNNAALDAMTEAIDLDKIYRVAVGELGMVFPNNNQVVTYEGNDTGYVRQFEDIPAIKQSIIDKILP
ncbi:MAG: hypothetical protein E7256_09015 [Lachnospiraceae bacterium]|nr:hypothetical protein [Lachnospiraceae bacterium]